MKLDWFREKVYSLWCLVYFLFTYIQIFVNFNISPRGKHWASFLSQTLLSCIKILDFQWNRKLLNSTQRSERTNVPWSIWNMEMLSLNHLSCSNYFISFFSDLSLEKPGRLYVVYRFFFSVQMVTSLFFFIMLC